MKPVIEALWGKLDGNDGIELKVLTHQGNRDLEKSAPRKLKGWSNPNARFLILRDNDNADCLRRKARLADLVAPFPAAARCKIRIVCQELEAWFLGDLDALRLSGIASATFRRTQNAAPFRTPDAVPEPVAQLDRCTIKDVTVAEQKLTVATTVAPHMNPGQNASESFRQTVATLRGFIEELSP